MDIPVSTTISTSTPVIHPITTISTDFNMDIPVNTTTSTSTPVIHSITTISTKTITETSTNTNFYGEFNNI